MCRFQYRCVRWIDGVVFLDVLLFLGAANVSTEGNHYRWRSCPQGHSVRKIHSICHQSTDRSVWNTRLWPTYLSCGFNVCVRECRHLIRDHLLISDTVYHFYSASDVADLYHITSVQYIAQYTIFISIIGYSMYCLKHLYHTVIYRVYTFIPQRPSL